MQQYDPSLPVPPEHALIDPETVTLEDGTGRDYEPESREIPVTRELHHHVPADSGDPLTDLLRDVWIDSGTDRSLREWWDVQLAYFADHAQFKLRRGRNGHLHSMQGTDVVAAILLRITEKARGATSVRYIHTQREQGFPPSTWDGFKRYMYRAIENECQTIGKLERVDECAAPWEMYSDADDDGKHWSPADQHPDTDPHARIDAQLLGNLIREHTTDKERELLLFLWGGHTADSIAETLGGKREAVKRRITRLRKRLQPIFREQGYGWTPRQRGEPLRASAEGNVRGANHENVPTYPGVPLNKVEGGILPLLPRDRVPNYTGDTHVVTDAPVTVTRIRALRAVA